MGLVEGLPPQLEGLAERKPRLVLGKRDPWVLVIASILGDLGRGLLDLGWWFAVEGEASMGADLAQIEEYGCNMDMTSIWVGPNSAIKSTTSDQYCG